MEKQNKRRGNPLMLQSCFASEKSFNFLRQSRPQDEKLFITHVIVKSFKYQLARE